MTNIEYWAGFRTPKFMDFNTKDAACIKIMAKLKLASNATDLQYQRICDFLSSPDRKHEL